MATPSRCPHRLVRFPPSSRTTAPNSGNTSSSHAARCAPTAGNVVSAWAATTCATASEPVTALLLVPGQAAGGQPGNDHRGRRDYHHEERDDLAGQVAVQPGEGHERQVDGVQHQLHAHEDDHGES